MKTKRLQDYYEDITYYKSFYNFLTLRNYSTGFPFYLHTVLDLNERF